MARAGALPLDGVRVLDLTQLLPGPTATQALGDLGASVVKLERPGGDPVRTMMPGYFEAVNRNKRSIAVDLKTGAGRAVARRLARASDVLVEGFRPGVAARLGIDFESVRDDGARLVYCSLSGFGQTGPRRLEPGHDVNYLAIAGAIDPRADRLGTPLPIADSLGALWAACAIVAALQDDDRRAATYVDVAIAEGVLATMAPVLAEHAARGGPAELPPRPAYGVYRTADDALLSVGCTEDHFWRGLCEALELPAGLACDAELAGWEGRARRSEEIDRAIAERIARRPLADWLQRLAVDAGLPVAAVSDLADAPYDDQFEARGVAADAPAVGFPALFDGRRPGERLPPPALGEHTRELLAELGYPDGEVDDLLAAGAVAESVRVG